VRRTREYLEQTLDPETGEPYLQPVLVRLFGEGRGEALTLPPFLQDAYDAADEFCLLVGQRPGLNSGFLKTILLRRVGSTIQAGRRTARKMLGDDPDDSSVDDEADEDIDETPAKQSALYPLRDDE